MQFLSKPVQRDGSSVPLRRGPVRQVFSYRKNVEIWSAETPLPCRYLNSVRTTLTHRDAVPGVPRSSA